MSILTRRRVGLAVMAMALSGPLAVRVARADIAPRPPDPDCCSPPQPPPYTLPPEPPQPPPQPPPDVPPYTPPQPPPQPPPEPPVDHPDPQD